MNLMDLLLLPLSKTVHLIGLLRSEQSSPLINVDVALTFSLNVIQLFISQDFKGRLSFLCTVTVVLFGQFQIVLIESLRNHPSCGYSCLPASSYGTGSHTVISHHSRVYNSSHSHVTKNQDTVIEVG